MGDLARVGVVFVFVVLAAVVASGDALAALVDPESWAPCIGSTLLLPSSQLTTVVSRRVLGEADHWFPELDGSRLVVRIGPGKVRARCYLHRIELDDGRLQRSVLLKVRHSVATQRRRDRYSAERPRLSPEHTMSAESAAALEFEGLEQISLFARSDERFGVVRALASLPEDAAIVLGLMDQPTLLERVLATSRTRRRPTRGCAPEVPARVWTNAGAWLRRFHDRLDGSALPVYAGGRDELGALYARYADFLGRHLPGSAFPRVLEHTSYRSASAWLDDPLPLAVGHGDFVANNMFVSTSGAVAGFDPLPCRRVVRYQDLATLTVGMRVHPLQSLCQGCAIDRSALARYEQALLGGYFGEADVPLTALRAFQLLALLDRWSDLLSKQVWSGPVRYRMRAARVRLANHHYEREAHRILRGLPGPPAVRSTRVRGPSSGPSGFLLP